MSSEHFSDDRRSSPPSKKATASRSEAMGTSVRSELAIAKHSDGRAYEQEEKYDRLKALKKSRGYPCFFVLTFTAYLSEVFYCFIKTFIDIDFRLP